MGLFDSVTDIFSNALGDIFGSSSGSYLGGSNQLSAPSTPVSYQYPIYQPEYPVVQQPVMASMPMVVGAARSLVSRFPNLYSSIVALSQQFGRRFTPEMVWRMLKQQGPGMVVGLIGAAAMNELFVWKTTHKTRRMNPANTKALRRSLRRLKSFDKLSGRVSSQLARAGGGRRRRSSGRCGTCKRSPCSC